MMKFTRVPANAFKELVFNAGVILSDFNPATGEVSAANIICATTGGLTFASNPSDVDFGEDVDNVPNNTKQLKRRQSYDPTLSGTAVSVTPALAKSLVGGAEIDAENAAHIVPRGELSEEDFANIWLVADYSDKNTGTNAGFVAIHIMNALNTAGFQLTTGKDAKGQFAFEYHGHYDLEDIDTVPFEIYVQAGSAESGGDDGGDDGGDTPTP